MSLPIKESGNKNIIIYSIYIILPQFSINLKFTEKNHCFFKFFLK
jgi:hypothetical protein